jgi:hypothetical protein
MTNLRISGTCQSTPESQEARKPTHCVPSSWYSEILFIYAIPGNGDLADVVQKILSEKLNAGHLYFKSARETRVGR